MINKDYTYAVIGASQDEEKYGYKVLKDLKESGYRVIPINPRSEEILGLKTYKNILDIEEDIDVAIFVVPPSVSERVIMDVKNKGIKNVWFQPGSESKEVIEYCKNNEIKYINNACIMIERN